MGRDRKPRPGAAGAVDRNETARHRAGADRRMDGCCARQTGGMSGRKGVIALGADADFAVFDPDASGRSRLPISISGTRSRRTWAPSCAAACWKHGCAVSRYFRAVAIRWPGARQRAGAPMKERAQTRHRRMPAHRRDERGAGPHDAQVPHASRARSARAAARAHGSAGHDRECGRGGQSARVVATARCREQAVDPRLAHRHRAQCRRIRRHSRRHAGARMCRDRAGTQAAAAHRGHCLQRRRGRALWRAFHRQPRGRRAIRSCPAQAKDADGVTLEDAIRAFGLDPGQIDKAALDDRRCWASSRSTSNRGRCSKQRICALRP